MIPVLPNDIFFGLHAMFATMITILQCIFYEVIKHVLLSAIEKQIINNNSLPFCYLRMRCYLRGRDCLICNINNHQLQLTIFAESGTTSFLDGSNHPNCVCTFPRDQFHHCRSIRLAQLAGFSLLLLVCQTDHHSHQIHSTGKNC
jgi:hypothetical protein